MSARRCPTCAGKGTVDRVKGMPRVLSYCGPNGERCPQETCPNCYGSGWVGTPDGPMSLPEERP